MITLFNFRYSNCFNKLLVILKAGRGQLICCFQISIYSVLLGVRGPQHGQLVRWCNSIIYHNLLIQSTKTNRLICIPLCSQIMNLSRLIRWPNILFLLVSGLWFWPISIENIYKAECRNKGRAWGGGGPQKDLIDTKGAWGKGEGHNQLIRFTFIEVIFEIQS